MSLNNFRPIDHDRYRLYQEKPGVFVREGDRSNLEVLKPKAHDDSWKEIVCRPGMSLEEIAAMRQVCMAKMQVLDEDILKIKGQLEQAAAIQKETGEWADSDWWRRAKGAARAKGFQRQRLQEALGEFNKAERRAGHETFGQRFIDAARRLLPPEQFAAVHAAAHEPAQEPPHAA